MVDPQHILHGYGACPTGHYELQNRTKWRRIVHSAANPSSQSKASKHMLTS